MHLQVSNQHEKISLYTTEVTKMGQICLSVGVRLRLTIEGKLYLCIIYF